MVLLAYLLRSRAGINGGMLIYNVQRILARYETRDDLFMETVSGLPFDMANQMSLVIQRLESEV